MDGVIVVDKPAGPTSHDIVDRVRNAVGERRVGHTGTLDPFATGVLPVCVGKATRLVRFIAGGTKAYRASVRLGFATTTDDLTGEPLGEARECRLSREAVERAAAALVGSFDQVPPAFSAKHVGGRRLYQLARRGEAAARPATPVTVFSIELVALEGDRLDLEVQCSPGTYVRALARDLGEGLGVGGHLTALRRTRSGAFDLSQAVSLDGLAECEKHLIPLEALLTEFPAVRVSAGLRRWVRNGRRLGEEQLGSAFPDAAALRVRLVDEAGTLLALAVRLGGETSVTDLPNPPVLHPDVVLVD